MFKVILSYLVSFGSDSVAASRPGFLFSFLSFGLFGLVFSSFTFICLLVCLWGAEELHATACLEVRGPLTKVTSLRLPCEFRDPTQVLRPGAMHLTPWAVSPTSCFVFLKQGLSHVAQAGLELAVYLRALNS